MNAFEAGAAEGMIKTAKSLLPKNVLEKAFGAMGKL